MAIPFLTGGFGNRWTWQHGILAFLWLSGYFCFAAFDLWMSERRKNYSKARLPFCIWFTATVIAGLWILYIAPQLLCWLVLFTPVAFISLQQTIVKNARSLLARSSEVIAAGLMCVVAWHLSVLAENQKLGWSASLNPLNFSEFNLAEWTNSIPSAAIETTVFITAYFWSTIPFVKSLMRERNSRFYHALSALSHGIFLIAAIVLTIIGKTSLTFAVFWLILILRACLFTQLSTAIFQPHTKQQLSFPAGHAFGHRRIISRPEWLNGKTLLITVGITETVLSVIYMLIVLTSLR